VTRQPRALIGALVLGGWVVAEWLKVTTCAAGDQEKDPLGGNNDDHANDCQGQGAELFCRSAEAAPGGALQCELQRPWGVGSYCNESSPGSAGVAVAV
jgi:hypothetical protein